MVFFLMRKKCELITDRITWYGRTISAEGVQISTHYLQCDDTNRS